MENFCNYYQVYLVRPSVVEIIGILKSFDHIAFDRTLDPASSLFEFFVPKDQTNIFLELMSYFEKKGMVHGLRQLPNRLITEDLVLLPKDGHQV